MLSFPIQQAKVQRPPLRAATLTRPRLTSWLDDHINHRVVSVTAEAGYGKTTLLADYARRPKKRILWFRIDEDDANWCNIAYAGTCWDVERALVHEAGHVTMGVAYHDGQGETNTVMGSVSPWYANLGWDTRHIQRCDQAAGQLLTGLANPYGRLADCFDHVPGHGVVGLLPALTSTTTAIVVCRSQTAVLTGGFTVANDFRYKLLAGVGLGGRTVWFDRKPHTSSVWTLNIASASTGGAGSWSRGFSTGSATTITYDFRPHTSSETGLDAATGPIMAVTWSSGC